MLKLNRFLAGAFVACMGLAATGAQAAVIGVVTNTYGNGAGQIDPGGNDALGDGFVTVSDRSSERFSDTLDFSSLAGTYSSIDSLALTLAFDRAGPSVFPLSSAELWSVRIQGSNSGSIFDDVFVPLVDILSPQTVTISLLTDFLTVNAFSTSVAAQKLTFWFAEATGGADAFRLNSATLTVNGTPLPPPAVVPLPAAGLMLLGGLGMMAALRRRKAVTA